MGGAARAAYRLHRALLREGVGSRMLVQRKFSDDNSVIGPLNTLQKVVSRLRPFFDSLPVGRYKEKKKTLFSPAWLPFSGIAGRINALKPDIVHLHWICDGMLRIEDIAGIQPPVVWSLHDMWAFTGGCHCDHECGRYRASCGKCLVLGSDRERDLSREIFLRKRKIISRCNGMTINALSGWLARCARESALFKDLPVVNLPNPIDTDIFKPVPKILARELLNLPQDRKIVLFGAMNATGDPNKGFHFLSQAMPFLRTTNIQLAVFGSGEPLSPPDLGFPTRFLGRLSDDLSLKILYSAADVTVVPSLQENLSNTIMESLASGTPVVGFDIGGNSDMIDHKRNGYLASPSDPADLACGIDWILGHSVPEALSEWARKKIVDTFEARMVAVRYKTLYDGILKRNIHKTQ
jgi:glycosyltransferase involved in cell wall biosynthesis